jgi:molecular chaperone DnaK
MREIEQSDRPANVIGIDLGATEVRVARFNEAGKPEITNNAEGSDVTPAVIQIEEDGAVIIGTEAKKFLGTGRSNVFTEFKREMGNDKSWTVGAKNVTPVELSALLLKKVVADYADQFGQPQHIAITWPANYRNEQREATKEAAARAGLKVEYYIEEPTAAALYYATDTAFDGKYLIYDFGGGTFDVTLFEAHHNNISVISQDGVQQLGGKDLDNALLKIIGDKFRAKTGHDFDVIDCNFDKLAVESNKNTLSTLPSVRIRLVSGKHGLLAIDIERGEFENAISHLVNQAEMACENVLRCGKDDRALHVKKSDIRDIFMVGAISRVPAMQASVERLFGKKPKIKNPEHAVAMGAAIFAALKSSRNMLNTCQRRVIDDIHVANVAPHFYGIIYANWLTGGSTNITVIRKGESLPARRGYRVKADPRGYLPTISLTQSAIEETNPEYVTKIWEGEFHRCAPNAEVDLVFSYDEHGTMCFSVTEVATGKYTTVDLRPSSDEHRS